MQLDKLKNRSSFILGDKDYPLPHQLCLIKLTDSYFNRANCPFCTKYVVAYLNMVSNVPKITMDTKLSRYSIVGTWNEKSVEWWIYLDKLNITDFKKLK